MPSAPSTPATVPPTVWPARGRHTGPAAEDALRRRLQQLKNDGTIVDHLELPEAETGGTRVFEARWLVPEGVTVRARLALRPDAGEGRDWVLAAEAEQPWDPRWLSPATVFWPESADVVWDREPATGARLRELNLLPEDDKEVKRLLRNAVRSSWNIHVVVHEAMTPDERGRRPLARLLPPGLRHRVVEHRAAPHQFRVVNYALRDVGVQVPRGGAVVLPTTTPPTGSGEQDFSVRSVFLDGSEPVELLDAVTRYAALPRPLPDEAAEALTALRENWHLLTLQEELDRERALVAMYAEALDAMTTSRDLYREAAERAGEALAVYRESAAALPPAPAERRREPSAAQAGSPLQQLTRTFERLRGAPKALRPASEESGADGSHGTSGP
ncbi:hypothetical protein ABZT03_19695 [Streptomyces sp. NPDC005574]|uniref:hypothetical protein n=1 Tax=Streptomyces sp. NPDC005574 TaxID=3156891 RepID=UPI00339E5AB9